MHERDLHLLADALEGQDENGGGGLSPRGRGNQLSMNQCHSNIRSIPAWAGEPRPTSGRSRRCWVYPRVGGGTLACAVMMLARLGLSPRGRGNHPGVHRCDALHRSIPAWAGEPGLYATASGLGRVYPRVGGGTHHTFLIPSPSSGLSPRGRGNHVRIPMPMVIMRSIPAWAGEPQLLALCTRSAGVYPRVGGEPQVAQCPPWVLLVYPRVGGGTISTSTVVYAI